MGGIISPLFPTATSHQLTNSYDTIEDWRYHIVANKNSFVVSNVMAKTKKDIVVLDSDDSVRDVEVVSSSLQRRAVVPSSDDDVVDLTSGARASSVTAPQNNSRRRRHTDDEVEFVGARQQSAVSAAAASSSTNDSSDIQFIGTKRPRTSHSNAHRTSFPANHTNNFNNGNSIMNNPISNTGGFMDRLHTMLGFGRGANMNLFNPGNIGVGGGMGPMGFDRSADPSRYGVNDQPSYKKKKAKTSSATPKEEETTAMLKGKAMQQPNGFDAIDMYYPRLKANERTRVLHNLLSKCTSKSGTNKFVHDFRVKFEKANPKATLWSLAKALSEEITRLEGESKMPAKKKKLKSEEDGNHHKENKPNVGCIISNNGKGDTDSDKKPSAPIGSLSGAVLDTLATYFDAHLRQKDHKKMLDAIEPTESSGSLTCCICSDDFDAGDTVACSGDDIHFFCKPCLASYCTVTLESGPIQSITCAIPNCKALFATHDIKSILSEYDILRIEHREDSRDRRVAMAAKAMLHCECGVVAIVTEEDMGDGRIACPGSGCGRRFCAKCGNEDHGKDSCPPPAETVQWLDNNSKPCPNCANRIEKNGGCDHMKCLPPGGCGYDFWYSCGCKYPGPHKCR